MINTITKIELLAKIILWGVLVLIALYIAIINTLSYESEKENARLTMEIHK